MRLLRNILQAACLMALTPIPATAQSQKIIDSIERLLPAQKDTVLAASYNELTWQYRKVNPAKAISYGQKAIELSRKINYPKGEAQAYNDLGILYMDTEDYGASLNAYTKAIPIRKKLNDKKGLAAVYLKIGILHQKSGKYDLALANGQNALKLYEELKDDVGIATALNNIGITNHNIGHDKEAINYYERALEIYKRLGNSNGIGLCYMNMGNAYLKKGNIQLAKVYLEQADSLGTALNATEMMSTAANNLAGIYEQTGPLEKGLEYVERAYNIRRQTGDIKGMVSSLAVWGSLLTKTQNYMLAEDKLDEGLRISDTLPSCLPERMGIYTFLSKLYENTGDYKKAAEMSRMVLVYKDSIYTTTLSKQFSELEVRYQTAVKEREIQQQKFEVSKRNYLLLGMIGVLLLGTLLAYSYYHRFKLKKDHQLQAEIIRQQDLASRGIIEAEERERKRIAGDLHDGLGQLFSAVRMNMNAIGGSVQFKDEETARSFDKTLALVDESCKEVRTISHQMMPNTLLKYGLVSAVRDFIHNLDTRRLKVNLEVFGLDDRLDSNTETVLYRVLQEVVNNVIKHSRATQLDIQLSRDEDAVSATIEDNGKGFDLNAVEQRDGIGLKNIRTRVEFLKGHVEFDSMPGRGTVVSLWVPLTAQPAVV